MSLNWRELLQSSPHELRISGPNHSKQLEEENGLSDLLYRIFSLNFLEVSKTSLNVLSTKIKELENLTALMLYDNKLKSLPKEIGHLKKLKTLDVSNNKIESLPEEMCQLVQLQSLNIINNKISRLPKDLTKWSNLIVIKLSHNNFQQLPEALCSPTFKQHLTEIHATDNEINLIPTGIGNLTSLRHLDLTNNKIEFVPGELSDCLKIKTLCLQANPIKDMRLRKLAEKNPTKQILQHVAKNCPRGGVCVTAKKGPKSKQRNVSTSSDKVNDELDDEIQNEKCDDTQDNGDMKPM